MAFIERAPADPRARRVRRCRSPRRSRACSRSTPDSRRRACENPDEAGAAATDYLRLFALVALAYMWARMVQVAQAKLAAGADGDAAFYEAKVQTARFFMTRMLPESGALFAQIMAGGSAG